MTNDDFNLVSGFLTSEVQRTLAKHFEIGVSTAQADAIVSALAMVVGMYAAQDAKIRTVFDKVLDLSINMIGSSERFRTGFETLQSGGTPERALDLDVPDIASVVQTARFAEHGPDTCLCCAISELTARRYGETLSAEKLDEVMQALVGAVIVQVRKAGLGVVAPFVAHLNGMLARVAEEQSTEGMTAQ